ncbi:unnamed protein product [Parnassius apollo]|uniref:(apollo) hypothetical protein n=1 Tax=Parnassius apollo TaxID=110799 RepID=A0A8S3Y923_PARAO|nr:unnamed protein product [Parnassius apollo]
MDLSVPRIKYETEDYYEDEFDLLDADPLPAMSRKMFFGINSFIGLEEAITAVTTDSDDDCEYDLEINTT